MPLSAILNDSPIYAYRLSPKEWAALKQQDSKLRFSCCTANVILKRSPLGTQFFAHARKGNCSTAPETAEHLQAKDTIARTSIAVGWDAATEVRGVTPDGCEWVADVMISRGNVRLAFEVQWSPQTYEDTLERHKRYEMSGVRALWLMRQKNIPNPSRDLPAFRLILDDQKRLQVGIDWNTEFNSADTWVGLAEFVQGALRKSLVWRPLEGSRRNAKMSGYLRECWNCNEHVVVPYKCSIGRYGSPAYFSFGLMNLFAKAPGLRDTLWPTNEAEQKARAEVWIEDGRSVGHCFNCGAPITTNLNDPRHYERMITLPDINLHLTGELLDAIDAPLATDIWGFLPQQNS